MSRQTLNYCCIDCGNLIDIRTALYGKGRCHPCSLLQYKRKGNPNYKHGELCKREKLCVDCGKKLKSMRAIRCLICDTKLRIINKKWPYRNGNFKVKLCIDCGKKLASHCKCVKRCWSCWKKIALGNPGDNINKHHVDTNRKNNHQSNILILTSKKHSKLHARAYNYLVETGQVWNYIEWFDKKFGLK